jgi:rubrerythrin
VQLESQGAALEAKGDPVFLAAGTAASGEFHCAECGYGIAVRSRLPECPMCRGIEWEEPATSPYSRTSL